MLLGVLAQVDQAVAPFATGPSDSSEGADARGEAAASVQSAGMSGVAGEDTVDRGLDLEMDVDMGVAVSREEVMLSIEQDAAPRPAPSQATGQPHPRSISLPINPSSKRKLPTQTALSKTEPPSKEGSTNTDPAKPKKPSKKAGNDEFDNIFGPSEEDTAPAPTKSQVKKKAKPRTVDEESNTTAKSSPPHEARLSQKKKKTRDAGGDEFDDIFGSLDDGKSKKPKKKKRKKGDEFDDIFGGL
ncbi:hypothetical protein F5144DRAFT_280813 [Chaetomium tenue]|uniref:Uncharacterized protein n=1 Tax=Chaetomium tenue TaxID=1854479 RepID=A0ACB7P385_9PEZI|nr:hypothetical protein F5144DRAFT_280813 [Chaetomium globosum]